MKCFKFKLSKVKTSITLHWKSTVSYHTGRSKIDWIPEKTYIYIYIRIYILKECAKI